MPIYPRARVRLIDRYQPGGSAGGVMPSCHRLILHTAVSAAPSLFEWFSRPGNAVAHFYVAADGSVEQYVNTDRRSSAVLNGNHDAISVETQDKGRPFHEWSGSNVPAWTEEQVRALAEIAVWCHRHHGIPLHRLLSSRPGLRGVGWHRQGVNGNFPRFGLLRGRVPAGELWSESFGKPCPGDRRIKQVVAEVLPLARRLERRPVEPRPLPVRLRRIRRMARAGLANPHARTPLRSVYESVIRSVHRFRRRVAVEQPPPRRAQNNGLGPRPLSARLRRIRRMARAGLANPHARTPLRAVYESVIRSIHRFRHRVRS
jgi:hypothetical protein